MLLGIKDLVISKDFNGKTVMNGNIRMELAGDFGEEYHQIAYYRKTVPICVGKAVDFWPEYSKGAGVSVIFEITKLSANTEEEVEFRKSYEEQELAEPIHLLNSMRDGELFLSIKAKGTGNLRLSTMHIRECIKNKEYLIPGTKRLVSKNREELFSYFEEGDKQAPLNVFFTGCFEQEGFDGYEQMKATGAPFLLLCDPRQKGSLAYLGEEDYEAMVLSEIRQRMESLGFDSEDVIFAGESIGTFGALYYGCEIVPSVMMLAKPIASLGNVAGNERILRPGGYPQSLDLLYYLYGEVSERSAQWLNERLWNRFDTVDFGKTTFIVSYMREDDYDPDAYTQLLSHLTSEGVEIYGRGLQGRHNDNTTGIRQWFYDQYRKVLKNDFNRG